MKKFFFFFFFSISLAFANPDDQGWFNWATKHISRATHTVKQTGILEAPYQAGRFAIRGIGTVLFLGVSYAVLPSGGDAFGLGEHCYANARSCLSSHYALHGHKKGLDFYIVGDADWEKYDDELSRWLWNGLRGRMPQLLGPFCDLCFPAEQWYPSPPPYCRAYL